MSSLESFVRGFVDGGDRDTAPALRCDSDSVRGRFAAGGFATASSSWDGSVHARSASGDEATAISSWGDSVRRQSAADGFAAVSSSLFWST